MTYQQPKQTAAQALKTDQTQSLSDRGLKIFIAVLFFAAVWVCYLNMSVAASPVKKTQLTDQVAARVSETKSFSVEYAKEHAALVDRPMSEPIPAY